MKDSVLDAGTAVVVLLALFAFLTVTGVALTVFGVAGDVVARILEWAGAAFAALLIALNVRRSGEDTTRKNGE